MEYLDIYDENGNYIGKETRENVHKNALWHKTVHCWLYDKEGNVYFQIRADVNKLYTTASGHIKAGETVKQGFAREIKEEIGINVNYEKAELVKVNAQDTLDLINGTKQSISSIVYKNINNTVEKHDISDISIDNFLVNKGETAIEKYGDILTKVIDLTK